jgi:lambda family phage tail tape measure protein
MSSSNNNSTIVFSVDATGVEAGVNKIKAGSATVNAAMDAMAKRAALVDKAMQEAAANGFELNSRAANKLASEYIRLEAATGKTQAQMLAQKASANGVTSTFASMDASIKAASEHTHGFSLASSAAKRELLVLAHELSQGNYKKFGGSMLVLGEQTGAAGLLFSAAGLGALGLGAALAGVVYEAIKGAEQFSAFNKAIQATGGFIGLNAGQMEDLSAGMMGAGQSLTTVHEAMAQVAATGAFTADNLRLATTAALDMSTDIGIGTDKAAESLAKIQDNVMEWVGAYQKAHHTFSAAQIEEIENFVKMGDTGSAVKAVMLDLANAHDKIAADADKNMGAVITWWHEWGSIIDRVKASILGIGVPDSTSKLIGDQMARVSAAQLNITEQQALGMHGNVALAQQQLAAETKKLGVLRDQQAVQFQAQKATQKTAVGGDADVRAHTFLDDKKYANPADKHQLELDENKKSFEKATTGLDHAGALYAEAVKRNNDNIAQINADYAKKTKTHGTSGIGSQLADLMGQNKLIEQEEKRSEQTLKAQRDAGLVDSSQYLQQLHDLQAGALTKEIALAQQRADVAGGKKDKATQTTALAQVKEYNAQRDALDQTLTQDLVKVNAQRSSDMQKFADAQGESLRSQQAAIRHASATMFMDPVAKANSDAAFALSQNYYKAQEQLRAQYDGPTADQAVYAAKLADLDTYHKAQLDLLQTSQAQQFAVRSSYSDQIKLAMTQFMGDSQTNAQLMGTAFSSAYSTMSSQLETFLTTGKGSWASFTESIIADFAKIALKAAEQQIFTSAISMFSTGGAVGSYADGGSIVGAGTGTSDSIPAMLSNGEYVIQASSVKKYGSLLDSINNGTASHFASGGAVGTVAPSSGGSSTSLSLSLSAGNSGMTQADLAAIAPHIQTLIDKRMNQRMSQQGGFADLIRQGKI